MSDQALENAKNKREQLVTRRTELEIELTALRADLADADDFIANWYRYAGVQPVENANISGTVSILSASPMSPTPKKVLTNSKKEDVAAEVRRMIEAKGEPILRKDLLPALIAKGFKIEGSDPDMVLSTMLWRAGDSAGVIRLKKGGYWMKEAPWPAAGYSPSLADMFTTSEPTLGDELAIYLKETE